MKKLIPIIKSYISIVYSKLFDLFKPVLKWRARRILFRFLRQMGNCSTFFGMPGTGKTSFCAYIYSLAHLLDIKVYSNVPIIGSISFSKSDFGKYDMSGTKDKPSIILIDEGSLFYDGRNFQTNFNQQSLEYLKLLRHRHNHLLIFSQSLDIDIKFIRMSFAVYQIKRAMFGRTKVEYVRRKVDIDENTHQFVDMYYKNKGLLKLFVKNWKFFRFPLYKYFDSYEAPELPKMIERKY